MLSKKTNPSQSANKKLKDFLNREDSAGWTEELETEFRGLLSAGIDALLEALKFLFNHRKPKKRRKKNQAPTLADRDEPWKIVQEESLSNLPEDVRQLLALPPPKGTSFADENEWANNLWLGVEEEALPLVSAILAVRGAVADALRCRAAHALKRVRPEPERVALIWNKAKRSDEQLLRIIGDLEKDRAERVHESEAQQETSRRRIRNLEAALLKKEDQVEELTLSREKLSAELGTAEENLAQAKASENRFRNEEAVRTQNAVAKTRQELTRDIALAADDAMYCLNQGTPDLQVVRKRLQAIQDLISDSCS